MFFSLFTVNVFEFIYYDSSGIRPSPITVNIPPHISMGAFSVSLKTSPNSVEWEIGLPRRSSEPPMMATMIPKL